MTSAFDARVRAELDSLVGQNLVRIERVIRSAQGRSVRVRADGDPGAALNFCANNYLGLAADPRTMAAAVDATMRWGAGTASVRFICGTLEIHKELEGAIADYLGFPDAILFAAAFDANAAIFESLFGEGDLILSDALNHASIIDGIRLCRARRERFRNGDMEDLEAKLLVARATGTGEILIVTDGVFSMDGYLARLRDIRTLADRHGAMVMVDDSHATGVVGAGGRGTPRAAGAAVDFVTGTLGKALGGAMGGFICASAEVIELLRQRARPYLFSNALLPAACGAALVAIDIARSEEGDRLRDRLRGNTQRFRAAMSAGGFELLPGKHPIVPVMMRDAGVARDMSARLLEQGVLAAPFSFPVVPRDASRIRIQLSAAHTSADVDRCVSAFLAARGTGGGAT